MALLVALLIVSGMVFQMAIKAYRRAEATREISRKLRTITSQLDRDMAGLRKDGEVLVVWRPIGVDADGNPVGAGGQVARYERHDVMLFFADGNFQSYGRWPLTVQPGQTQDYVVGNLALVMYMQAFDASGDLPQFQEHKDRILARSQHIFTADPRLVATAIPPIVPLDPANIVGTFTDGAALPLGAFRPPGFCNQMEYLNLTMQQWMSIPLLNGKADIVARVANATVTVTTPGGTVDRSPPPGWKALQADGDGPLNVHLIMCEGVGEFYVQGWYEAEARWYPEIDRDGDGLFEGAGDTDFVVAGGRIDETRLIGRWWNATMEPFEEVVGLGRALKFTFTLYDSRGVFKEGKTFTHIVRMDD